MIKISLDTNAVIDFCYRCYAEDVFASIWGDVERFVNSNMIAFYMSDAIFAELHAKVNQFEYPVEILDTFIKAFKVKQIEKDAFAAHLIKIQQYLLGEPYSLANADINHIDNDMSVIALAMHESKCYVLTSEQGFGKNMSVIKKSGTRNVKIPDVCNHMNVRCVNWLELFRLLGINSYTDEKV